MKYFLSLPLLLVPTVSFAASGSLQTLLDGIGGFINEVLIPFILGIAFLIFLINAVRFFVIGGDNQESQENAKSLALYGIGAFALLLSFWGIVNVFANSLGLNEDNCINGQAVQSDYLYGVDSLAPCSSPRPVTRPVTPTATPGPAGMPASVIPNN
jgi:succinate dehydrogenase/fumarate reductase cytochrome b subunit